METWSFMLAALKSNLKSTFPSSSPLHWRLSSPPSFHFISVWSYPSFSLCSSSFYTEQWCCFTPVSAMVYSQMCHFWEFGILSVPNGSKGTQIFKMFILRRDGQFWSVTNGIRALWESSSWGLLDPLGLALLFNSVFSHKVWQSKWRVLLLN